MTNEKKERSEMTDKNIADKLRDCLFNRRHHKNPWDVYPAVTQDLEYTYLHWEYDDNEIKVKTKDYALIELVKLVIDTYLEQE
jgi:hypothetical protein